MKKSAPVWIKVLVILHVAAITIWALPLPPKAIQEGTVSPSGSEWILYGNYRYTRQFPPVIDYVMVTGFWQYWDMFAPNPVSSDFYGDAIVTFKDGTTKVFDYPRIEKMPILNKYAGERYRKFFERVRQEEFSYLWPQFGLRIAQQMDTVPGNPPVSVKLRRNWIDIQPPGRPQWKEYRHFIFFEYIVDQRALTKLRTAKS